MVVVLNPGCRRPYAEGKIAWTRCFSCRIRYGAANEERNYCPYDYIGRFIWKDR